MAMSNRTVSIGKTNSNMESLLMVLCRYIYKLHNTNADEIAGLLREQGGVVTRAEMAAYIETMHHLHAQQLMYLISEYLP